MTMPMYESEFTEFLNFQGLSVFKGAQEATPFSEFCSFFNSANSDSDESARKWIQARA